MTSLPRLLGFPAAEKQDIVKFHFAKNLPYNIRITITIILLLTGFFLQLYFWNLFYGLPFLLIGIGLVLVKGYDSRIRLKSFDLDPNWKTVTLEKITELENLRKQTRKWDRDALDISNALGAFTFILLGALLLVIALILGLWSKDYRTSLFLIVDATIVLVPLWFSGIKFILKQPNLAIRVKLILKLHEAFAEIKKSGEEFKPALLLSRGADGQSVPVDARFTVVFPSAPEGFYGLQAQINLNVVQGHSYPYFYCVLAARPGFGMKSIQDKINTTSTIICEFQQSEKAEVLVIRQKTTRKSGYYTKDKQCLEILETALEGGREICS